MSGRSPGAPLNTFVCSTPIRSGQRGCFLRRTFASSELNALSAVLGIAVGFPLSHDSRQDSSPPSLDLYPLDLGPMYTPISLYAASLIDTWKITVPAGHPKRSLLITSQDI